MDGGGGATLLRFLSPRTALELSLFASYDKQHEDGVFGPASSEDYLLAPGIGVRRYSSDSTGLRGLWGAGLDAQYGHNGIARSYGVGSYGEAGAEFAFTPRLSLGAVGSLNVFYMRQTVNNGGGQASASIWRTTLSLARMIATVRF